VVRSAPATQFGDKLIARAHVGRHDLAVMRNFEIMDERRIGVPFPDQQAESRFGLLAGTCQGSYEQDCEKRSALHQALLRCKPFAPSFDSIKSELTPEPNSKLT